MLDLIAPHLPDGQKTPVIACGTVGARQGWTEAAYRQAPCKPPTRDETFTPEIRDARIAVRIVPGVSQSRPAADVMRGEETQIAGFLELNPDFVDGVLCLPGTHSKWVRISAGEIVSFQTFMTGELFGLLAEQSLLRHSVGTEGWDTEAFAEALSATLSRPETAAARLFSLRAEALLSGAAPVTARARLSGFLIGMELAAARPYWLGQDIAIIGNAELADVYREALAQQGIAPQVADADAMTLAGLKQCYHAQKESFT